MKISKKQGEYLDSISNMDNDQLFNEVLEVNYPDDYDGVFTDWGGIIKNAVNEEMVKRLKSINFLSDKYTEI